MKTRFNDSARKAGRRLSATLAALLFCATQAQAQVNVTTQHNDNMRTGANTSETVLKTSNVNVNTFGKLFSRSVDGQIYAQPLYVSGVAVAGKGTHNVVYVPTMHDSVYAFDADDPNQSAPLWKVSLGTPRPSGFNTKYGAYADVQIEIGIMSTPVIDNATKTMYVAAYTQDSASGPYHWVLHALDINSGAEKFGGPKEIKPSIAGSGDGSVGGMLTFNPLLQSIRPALTLSNGVVYIGSASFADTDPYHGWVIGYRASDLSLVSAFNTTRDGGEGGLWMAGQGFAVDGGGNLYSMTGNGTSNAKSGGQSYSQSFLKLGTANNALALLDWFMPSNVDALNSGDTDLGASGPLAIPGTNLIIGGGKEGVLYLINTGNMGKFNASRDAVVQRWQAVSTGHIHGAPVYYNGPGGAHIYVWGENDYLRAFAFNGSTFNTSASSASTVAAPQINRGMPGGFISISANGSTAGSAVAWATTPYNGDALHGTVAGIFRAFDANDVSRELWNSKQNMTRDDVGNFAKNSPPTIANGKVYVATFSNQLLVYGLLGGGSAPFANGTYKIVSQSSGLALDDPNGGGVGTGTDQWAYSGANQQWNLTLVSGNLYKITSAVNGLALTGATPGAQLTLQNYTGATNQLWAFNANGAVYTVVNSATGQLLDVFGNSTAANGVIGQWGATGAANQNWTVATIAGGGCTTKPGAPTGLAANATTGTSTNLSWAAIAAPANCAISGYTVYKNGASIGTVTGTTFAVTGLAPSTTYTFSVAATDAAGTGVQGTGLSVKTATGNVPFANGTYKIVSQSSGLALDDLNGGGAGTGIDQLAYSGTNQQWNLTVVSGSQYKITSVANGLAVTGASPGAQLTLQAYTGAASQLWTFNANGAYYTIANASTGQLFDVFGNSILANGVIGQWGSNGGANQNWTLTTVSGGSGATCYAAWNATTAYSTGATVSYSGVNYTAAFWTQNENPSTNNGPAGSGKPWTVVGTCN